MATSGSYNFALTRDNLIKRSYRKCNLLAANETLPSYLIEEGVDLLNMLLKFWQSRNLFLWNRKEATLFTAYQDYEYTLGPTGDHCTESYVSTQVATAASSGASTIVLDSTTGMTAADNVGIELDTGVRQWTTIASVDDSTTLTLDDTLDGAVAVDNYVVTYTTKIQRPLKILNIRSAKLNSDTEITMKDLNYDRFYELPNKKSDVTGNVSSWMYDRKLTNGKLFLYGRPADVDIILNLTYYEPIEDMDAASDDFEFPQEYQLPLYYGLAALIADAHNLVELLPNLQKESEKYVALMSHWDSDDGSIFIYPSSMT
jgi:hypothetical protein